MNLFGKNSKRHHPFHIYQDNTFYFLTSHTYRNFPALGTMAARTLLFSKIKYWLTEFNYELFAWVILDNHYHLLFKSSKGIDLPKIMSKIHAGFSYELNKHENAEGRKIWQNYRDKCIRSEQDLWRHFNYIHHNPIKHGKTKENDKCQFSSFCYWKEKKGNEWLESMYREYPIIDFTIEKDE